MNAERIGEKEKRLRELREARSNRTAPSPTASMAPAAKKKEKAMKTTTSTTARHKMTARTAPKRRAPKSRARGPRDGVSTQAVAEFICDAGPTMAELSKKFGVDAHPMRAKIHRAKHVLGYAIESRDGRYVGSRPPARR